MLALRRVQHVESTFYPISIYTVQGLYIKTYDELSLLKVDYREIASWFDCEDE